MTNTRNFSPVLFLLAPLQNTDDKKRNQFFMVRKNSPVCSTELTKIVLFLDGIYFMAKSDEDVGRTVTTESFEKVSFMTNLFTENYPSSFFLFLLVILRRFVPVFPFFSSAPCLEVMFIRCSIITVVRSLDSDSASSNLSVLRPISVKNLDRAI